MWIVLTLIFSLFLAYSNGGNDNFKGVATLYGGKVTNYKTALVWTSITTFLGSLAALYFASELIIIFIGKGLVPDSTIALAAFPVAVGLGAALTVMIATVFSLPVSTTHALIGALAGAGWIASPAGVELNTLLKKFLLPLLCGPFLSLFGVMIIYPILKIFRKKFGIKPQSTLKINMDVIKRVPDHVFTANTTMSAFTNGNLAPLKVVEAPGEYTKTYEGTVGGIQASTVLDGLHFISSGVVCFARGLNDTPKIAALILIGSSMSVEASLWPVAIAMLIGGLIHSKKIAKTMSKDLISMNPGQAFSANLVTGLMVLGASRLGIQMSTTHVSCGSIFGIGAVNKDINGKVFKSIVLAWFATLPLGFLLGLVLMGFLK